MERRTLLHHSQLTEHQSTIVHSASTTCPALTRILTLTLAHTSKIAMSFEDKKLPIKHIPGPQGVRGRNSDNTLIREKLGWSPSISIRDGLRQAYMWIKSQADAEAAAGVDITQYGHSKVVVQTTASLESNAAGGGARPEDGEWVWSLVSARTHAHTPTPCPRPQSRTRRRTSSTTPRARTVKGGGGEGGGVEFCWEETNEREEERPEKILV